MQPGKFGRDGVVMAEDEPTHEPAGVAGQPVSSPEPDLPQINGFRVIQELGRSPRGIIYRARRLVEQDVVSVKVYRGTGTRSNKFREDLTDNAETSFLLEHPGLVRCLGCVEDPPRFMLIQEYARGEPLARALQRNVRFMPPRALEIIRQCSEALAYAAERRRYHGRLHPGDLMIEDETARILGVGLGEHPEHPAWETRDPHLFEPLIYTATEGLPSRLFPSNESGQRALDLYALGGILYHMLTGTPPFRGTDEGTLIQERAALSPLVVRWPRGTERSLPARAITLVERLLSPDPLARGDYHSLLDALKESLREARGEVLPAIQPVTPPLAPVEIPVKPVAPPPPAALAGSDLPLPPVTYATTAHSQASRRTQPEGDRSPVLLIAAVAVVLAYALGLATRTFFPAPALPAPEKKENVQPEATVVAPLKTPLDTRPEPPVETREQQLAAHELKILKELVAEGAVKYDRPLLRKLQDIADRAGESSKTGIQAKLLMEEVKERLARAGTEPPVGTKTDMEAEERVFKELVARAQGLVAEQRFGDALSLLRELPPALKLAPFPERAAKESEQIDRQAQAAFAQIQAEAQKAIAAGDFAKARGVFQSVQVRWAMPQMAQKAEECVKVITQAEEKAFQAQAALRAQKARAKEQAELAALLRTTVAGVFEFRYKDAKEAMDKFVRGAQDPESRALATAYAQAIEDESGLFELGRQRLAEKIQRDRVSPLQVLSSTDRKPLYDIVDYDQEGIRIAAVRGGVGGEMVRPWKDWNPKQPFVMVQLLADKANAGERLALAILAFHQSLRAESLADEARDDVEKSGDYKRTAADLKNDAEAELNGAVQTDASMRGKQVALRNLFQRVAELLAHPPPVPPAPVP